MCECAIKAFLCSRRHVTCPKDICKVSQRALIAAPSLEQGLSRAQRAGHPDDPDRAARRLRRGVEGVWGRLSERLPRGGRGSGPCPVRKLGDLILFVPASARVLLYPSPKRTPCSPQQASPTELHGALERAREAFVSFRRIPAPRRGEIIRQIREALAAKVSAAWIALYRTPSCKTRYSSSPLALFF